VTTTYLTTEELAGKIKYDARTIREQLKDSVNRYPFGGRQEARSVIHGRSVRSLATNRKPAGGG
jgi:hypothetical protein